VCTSNEQCVDGDALGVCQPAHVCSFPDGGCPSGQRYGTHAPDALADECVAGDLVSALAANHHRIDLSWSDGWGAVDIEQDSVVIRTGVVGTTFSSRGLEPRTEYTYRIRAGELWSDPASATTAAEPMGDYHQQVLSDEPRAYWQMEETLPNTMSEVTGNIDAGIMSDGDPSAAGVVGSGHGFDGMGDDVALRTVHTAESDWGWSWELWVNLVALHGEGGASLLGCGNSPRWIVNASGSIESGMARRSDLTYFGADSGAVLTPGIWHHLVVTVEGAITSRPVFRLYADGVEIYETIFDAPLHSPWSRGENGRTGAGDLGLNHWDSFTGFEGTFDEAAAYDYVLSAAQIQRHFFAAIQ